jgi:hypothetical protein
MGGAVDQDERTDPFWMVQREPDRRAWHALGHQSSPLEAYGAKHGEDVSVRDLATLSVSEITLGGAVAPGVEPHVSAEAVQSSSEAKKPGVLDEEFNRIGDVEEQEFEGPIPAYLEGKVRPIGRMRVAGLR